MFVDRIKFVPKGGPDGGDVILRADVHTDNLSNLFYEPIIKAKNGGHGMGKKMHGRGAQPKVVKVSVGTVVYEGKYSGNPQCPMSKLVIKGGIIRPNEWESDRECLLIQH